ncbi:integrase core domain-containing protein [Pseudoalteromonas ruthenica]|uniref:integrase core domain-containing protein n=1 Tax=Pseudoalteromonas ruthenica TaxID=151081 RepID=UPI003D188BF4
MVKRKQSKTQLYPAREANSKRFCGKLKWKCRNECLNQHGFRTMEEARYEIDLWREHYNHVRPHSSLNYLSPVEFTKRAA